ncbi:MAG: hypothetical protein Q4G70_12510 [Pseudomonadota bacterium]|nr:hypothetical protein [Pseudomonadota bacterium]
MALSPKELQRIARSDGWRDGRVEVFDTASAGKVMVKGVRPARGLARYRLLNGVARLLGLPFLQAAPMPGGKRAQKTEVTRLRALHDMGACVPKVLHVGDDHFVMQWLGHDHLGNVIQAGHPHAPALWRKGGDALVRLHAAGQYLSQGFARNMVVGGTHASPHLAGWIDFEDDPLQVMSLPDAQVRDWLTYLHSTLWMLRVSDAEIDACIDEWMAAESPAVRDRYMRACRRTGWMRVLPRHRRFGRDAVSLQAAAAAAHRYLRRHVGRQPTLSD